MLLVCLVSAASLLMLVSYLSSFVLSVPPYGYRSGRQKCGHSFINLFLFRNESSFFKCCELPQMKKNFALLHPLTTLTAFTAAMSCKSHRAFSGRTINITWGSVLSCQKLQHGWGPLYDTLKLQLLFGLNTIHNSSLKHFAFSASFSIPKASAVFPAHLRRETQRVKKISHIFNHLICVCGLMNCKMEFLFFNPDPCNVFSVHHFFPQLSHILVLPP